MVIRGNQFDEAMYQYGLINGVQSASNVECPQILGEFLHDYAECRAETILQEMDCTVQAIMLQAKGGLENFIDGLYDGIKSVIEPKLFVQSLLDSAKELEGIKD